MELSLSSLMRKIRAWCPKVTLGASRTGVPLRMIVFLEILSENRWTQLALAATWAVLGVLAFGGIALSVEQIHEWIPRRVPSIPLGGLYIGSFLLQLLLVYYALKYHFGSWRSQTTMDFRVVVLIALGLYAASGIRSRTMHVVNSLLSSSYAGHSLLPYQLLTVASWISVFLFGITILRILSRTSSYASASQVGHGPILLCLAAYASSLVASRLASLYSIIVYGSFPWPSDLSYAQTLLYISHCLILVAEVPPIIGYSYLASRLYASRALDAQSVAVAGLMQGFSWMLQGSGWALSQASLGWDLAQNPVVVLKAILVLVTSLLTVSASRTALFQRGLSRTALFRGIVAIIVLAFSILLESVQDIFYEIQYLSKTSSDVIVRAVLEFSGPPRIAFELAFAIYLLVLASCVDRYLRKGELGIPAPIAALPQVKTFPRKKVLGIFMAAISLSLVGSYCFWAVYGDSIVAMQYPAPEYDPDKFTVITQRPNRTYETRGFYVDDIVVESENEVVLSDTFPRETMLYPYLSPPWEHRYDWKANSTLVRIQEAYCHSAPTALVLTYKGGVVADAHREIQLDEDWKLVNYTAWVMLPEIDKTYHTSSESLILRSGSSACHLSGGVTLVSFDQNFVDLAGNTCRAVVHLRARYQNDFYVTWSRAVWNNNVTLAPNKWYKISIIVDKVKERVQLCVMDEPVLELPLQVGYFKTFNQICVYGIIP